MCTNKDEVGLKRNLYEQSKPGVIDTSAVSPNWFTFIDHEWNALQRDFFEKSFDSLVVDLVSIFRKGNPNYINLGSLFGSEKKKEDDNEKIIYSINQVNRKDNDITKVEMFLDPDSYKITELCLYMQVFPSMNELKYKIEKNYSDLLVSISNEFVIFDNEFKLTIKK
ncbi:hypothetical protein [Paenibacillus durus]|uniref:Uncharacterized protein n=1 Tax=Paenibacillus durus TaxID=44251 RepID=A0A089HLN5_PAEDU|nr:hypothetical protein [Paenibacillus durus]AIQ11298.1 hypothetical protein PDUR_04295 [Paenibacillus durus]